MLLSAIVMTDRNIRFHLLALWSVNPCFELPTIFILKHFINPSMEYLIPIWWPSVSRIVQKYHGTRFSHCSCHCKTVSKSICLSKGATVTKGKEYRIPRGETLVIRVTVYRWRCRHFGLTIAESR